MHDTVLSNGLRVILVPDKRAPVVMTQLWYKVGSADEVSGQTGLAHVLEHMMFQGTDKTPPGAYAERISAFGGQENAFTSEDQTVYFSFVHRDQWPTVLSLESDRMADVSCTKARFEKELTVVKEERFMRVDDQPIGTLYERYQAIAHLTGPYHSPVIGWLDDLNQLTAKDCLEWHKKWYAPNHAVLVALGDIDTDEALAKIQDYFESIPSSENTKQHITQDQTRPGLREILVKHPAAKPLILTGFSVPTLPASTDEQKSDVWALIILANWLAGGAESLLEQSLVRDQAIAASVGFDYDPLNRFTGLLTLSVMPAQSDPFDVRLALQGLIEHTQAFLIDPDKLMRIKRQLRTQHVFSQDSYFAKARFIGQLAATGQPIEWLSSYPDKLDQVTAEQVRKVATQYLIPQSQTIAVLEASEAKQD